MKRIRIGAIAVLLAAIFLFCGPESHTLAASVPTISNATVLNQRTSLTLPSGGGMYIYAMATAGSGGGSSFANSIPSYEEPPVSIMNAAGHPVAAIAVTASNTNSYTTSTSSYTIAGFSVSGFGKIAGTYSPVISYDGFSEAPGANGVSAFAYVSKAMAGSVVVVVAIGGDECIASVSGLPGLVIDASNSNSGSPAIIIGHAYPSPGGYVVTMVSSQCAAGQPNQAGDLLYVFIFVPS